MPNEPKTDTLFGGRPMTAHLLDGNTVDLRVRQLPLRDYERAFALLDDEISLTAFCCDTGQPKAWAETLAPESYEDLRAVVEEVNAKGFFAWSARRLTKLAEQQQRMMEVAAILPPDALKLALDAGARLTLPSSLPISLRRPA